MEEVRGTTNLLRLVDRLRSEMTEAYYDDNDDRMKMTKPSIQVSVKDTYGGWFGASIDLNITLKQLRSITDQHEAYVLNKAQEWMADPRYEYKVWKATWSNEIKISMSYEFDDLRVKGDEDKFVGYTNSDGKTVLWD